MRIFCEPHIKHDVTVIRNAAAIGKTEKADLDLK